MTVSKGQVLEVSSTLPAPPEQIFRLLTEPTEVAKWWGPHGFTVVEASSEQRVGGNYRLTMQPPEAGEPFHVVGKYLEVRRPDRLVFTFNYEEPTPDDRETVVTLSLRALGDATTIDVSQGSFATEERLALHRAGWTDSLERLQQLVESNARNDSESAADAHS